MVLEGKADLKLPPQRRRHEAQGHADVLLEEHQCPPIRRRRLPQRARNSTTHAHRGPVRPAHYFEGLRMVSASAVMVMALLVLSIGIFPPRTSLWSASKSTTHVVRARNAGFCKSWANSCARTGDLDGARHRVALSLDGAPPHSEGSRATRPDAPIGRSRPSAAPNRRVQGP